MTTTLHVVSHTHWDREWYLTFQQFRLRLVDLIDNLLDLLDRDPDFRYFNLDAQTIVLEDYLTIKPQNRERLERFIRAGRITIGPWYQLNDEFLTSGESTVRSLLIGHRIAAQFGACMKIGYLPDQFGNLSQMPQIFRGFGIDNAILGRGYQLKDDRKMEFAWEGPDGSQVTASLMALWYNNAQHFPEDPDAAMRYTLSLRDRMTPHSAVSHLLLMNGVDHLEAQQNLSPILTALNRRLPEGTEIVHSTLPQYMDAVKAEAADRGLSLEKHVGELREDRGGACLAGTLSSRMYLKQANHHAQITLEKYAEPFSTFATLAGGFAYPHDFMTYAWKLLMQNHPHDSICGCSVDQVHREMMPRFAQVEQIGEELIERALHHLAERVDLTPQPPSLKGRGSVDAEASDEAGTTALVVFNSLNWTRTDPVIATLEFPLGIPTRGNPPRDDSKKVHGFLLTDETGVEVPFAVTNVEVKMKQVLSPVELPLDQWVQEYTIEFIAADVPACGYKTYAVTPRQWMPQYPPQPETSFTNEPHCFYMEDCGDVGDEYLHRKPLRDSVYSYFDGDTSFHQGNAVRHTLTQEGIFRLPIAATPDGQARSDESLPCRVRLYQTRWAGVPRVEVKAVFVNLARDHRLRMIIEDLFLKDAEVSHAEGQFDVVTRPNRHPLENQGASPFYPQQFWTAVTGAHHYEPRATAQIKTLAVMNKGLPEVEARNGQEGGCAVEVTLLRCVGQLSARGDGPGIPTPEAQCLGEHTFELAVYEHDGDWQQAKVWKQAHQFNVPLRVVQTKATPGQIRDLPALQSFVTVEPDALIVTAIKRAEDDPNTLIVRFFNTTEEPVTQARVFVRGATSARIVNLNEETQAPLDLDADGTVTLETVRPKQIITLAFGIQP